MSAALPARFERATFGLGSRCSIQLSYGSGGPQIARVELGDKGALADESQVACSHEGHDMRQGELARERGQVDSLFDRESTVEP